MWYAIRNKQDFKIVCCSGRIQELYPGWDVVAGPCKKESELFSPIVSVLYKEHFHDDHSVPVLPVSAHH